MLCRVVSEQHRVKIWISLHTVRKAEEREPYGSNGTGHRANGRVIAYDASRVPWTGIQGMEDTGKI